MSFVGISVIGMVNNYSPVPFWDMWGGIVRFHTSILEGNISELWRQHVSHRIVFSNLLFVVDNTVFAGSSKFLLFAHVILMALISVWFYNVLRLDQRFSVRKSLDFAVLMLVIAISFSWIQWRNITWAFQSQMFATNLFPATSFLLLYHASNLSRVPAQATAFFGVALVAGFCSAFTMMNGILALPIMVFLALALQLSIVRVGLIIITAAAMLSLYFRGYEKAEVETPFIETFMSDPLGILQFGFTQLGAPFYYISGEIGGDPYMSVALMGGVLMTVGFVFMSVRLIADPNTRKVGFFLVAVLTYVAATIGAIATGRQAFGPDQAVESRYMTNVLFAWSLFVVMLWFTAKSSRAARRFTSGYVVVMPVLLFLYQDDALNQNSWPRWEQNVGMLAVELGVPDQTTIDYVYPWVDILFEITSDARNLSTSIFGHPLFSGLNEQMGTPFDGTVKDVPACDISQEVFRAVPDSPPYYAIGGILFSGTPVIYPERFSILSEDGTIIGFTMTERSAYLPFREPLSHSVWMKGFVVAQERKNPLTLVSDTYSCFYDPLVSSADTADG